MARSSESRFSRFGVAPTAEEVQPDLRSAIGLCVVLALDREDLLFGRRALLTSRLESGDWIGRKAIDSAIAVGIAVRGSGRGAPPEFGSCLDSNATSQLWASATRIALIGRGHVEQ